MRYTDRMTTTVAIRLPDELVDGVDRLVAADRYSTRTDVIRSAVEALLTAHREAELDRIIVEGYVRQPESDDELAAATAATRALIEEEPW